MTPTPQIFHGAVCRELANLWPDRTIYPDVCRDDHARPSAFVQILESEPVPANKAMLRWSAKLLIVLWGDLDNYALADKNDLMVDQISVISTLMAAPLVVGDRHISVFAKDAGQDPEDGAAFVEVSAEWYGPLSDLPTYKVEAEKPPLMEQFYQK